MAKRIGGYRRKSRGIFRKNYKNKGKISLSKFFKEFKEGDKVVLQAEPAVQKGIYFQRYHGKSGLILGKKGSCYEVLIKDKNRGKRLVIPPIHLKSIR